MYENSYIEHVFSEAQDQPGVSEATKRFCSEFLPELQLEEGTRALTPERVLRGLEAHLRTVQDIKIQIMLLLAHLDAQKGSSAAQPTASS